MYRRKKLYYDALREEDQTKKAHLFGDASLAINSRLLALVGTPRSREHEELEEARRQLTLREVENQPELV